MHRTCADKCTRLFTLGADGAWRRVFKIGIKSVTVFVAF